MTHDDEPAWADGEAREILHEFYTRVGESLVILTLSRRGLDLVHNDFAEIRARSSQPDPTVTVAPHPLGAVGQDATARIRVSKLFELLDEGNGHAYAALSQQWIVLTFAMWEGNFRPRIAKAAGLKPKKIAIDALGDLRHMRNDIAHHLGIATRTNSGRCVSLRWFKRGEVVQMSPEQALEFVRALPGHELVPWGPDEGW
jgi:hypothetical protein